MFLSYDHMKILVFKLEFLHDAFIDAVTDVPHRSSLQLLSKDVSNLYTTEVLLAQCWVLLHQQAS